MANVLKIQNMSTTLGGDGTVYVAMTFQVVDGTSGAVQDYIFKQTTGEGSLTAAKVGVYEWGGMVFNITTDGSTSVVVTAIPRSEYPDDTHKITFTKTKTNWKGVKAGDTVSIDV